jgi:hypothetical protein
MKKRLKTKHKGKAPGAGPLRRVSAARRTTATPCAERERVWRAARGDQSQRCRANASHTALVCGGGASHRAREDKAARAALCGQTIMLMDKYW